MEVTEFFDSGLHDTLESVVVKTRPMEAIIVANQPKCQKAKEILERNRIIVNETTPKKSAFEEAEEKAAKALERINLGGKKVACRAIALLCHEKPDVFELLQNKISLKSLEVDAFVHLNKQVDSGLNVFDGHNASALSLHKVLNRTRTTGGDRMLKNWLRQPLTDKAKIEERLSLVEQFVDDSSARKSLHDGILRRTPDFMALGLKLRDKKATLQDLYRGYCGHKEITKAVELLAQMDSQVIQENFERPLSKQLQKMTNYVGLIDETLDIRAIRDENVFMLKASFDEKLEKIADEMNKIKSKILGSESKVASYLDLDAKHVKLELTNQHGYTFRVTRVNEKALRKKAGEFTTVDTQKAGVRFRDKRLDQLNGSFLEVFGN